MRIRKEDRQVLTEILDREWDDVEQLVDTVFNVMFERFLDREWYVAAVATNAPFTSLYGPFESESVAKRHVGGLVAAGPGVDVYQIKRMWRVRT